MPLVHCPNCQQTVVVNSYDTDVVHDCKKGVVAVDNESVVTMAEGTDNPGTPYETEIKRSAPNFQGIANRLNGTFAGIEGENSENYDVWGNRASTHRQRKRYEYFKVTPRAAGIKVN